MYYEEGPGINLNLMKKKIDQKILRLLARLEQGHQMGSDNKTTQTQFDLSFKQDQETNASNQKPLTERQSEIKAPLFLNTTRHKNEKPQRLTKKFSPRDSQDKQSKFNKTFHTESLTQHNLSSQSVQVKKGIRNQQSNPAYQQTLKARKNMVQQATKKFLIKRDPLSSESIQRARFQVNDFLKKRQKKREKCQDNSEDYKLREKMLQKIGKNRLPMKKT